MSDIKKTILALLVLFTTAVVPSFSQTADVRYAGVFYQTPASQSGTNLVEQMYCDFSAKAAQSGAAAPTWYTETITVRVPPALYTTVQDGTLSVRFLGTNVNASVSASATPRQPNTAYSSSSYYYVVEGGSTYYFQVLYTGNSSTNTNAVFLNSVMVSFDASATGQTFPDGSVTVKFLGKDVSSAVAAAAADRIPYHYYSVGDYYRVSYGSYLYYFEVVSTMGYTENINNTTWVSGHFVTYAFHPYTSIIDGDLTLTILSSCPSGTSARVSSTYYSLGDVYSLSGGAQSVTRCYQVTGIKNAFVFGPIVANNTANRSFVSDPDPSSNQNNTDPWVSSALIEYDQPYPQAADPTTNNYPNHCLALCMNVKCSNKPLGASTYSISFPLQQVKFDVVKYYNNKNVENAEETPAVRTIDLYPPESAARCGSYHCAGHKAGNPCASAGWVCYSDPCKTWTKDLLGNWSCSAWWPLTASRGDSGGVYCEEIDMGFSMFAQCGGWGQNNDGTCTSYGCHGDGGNCVVFNGDGTETRDTIGIPFCAAWDGSYEIAGEFGKTNGDFAFRATVSTDVPGDNIIVDKINFDSTIAYPGMNQIPIQVDVTNIHTVRSTPSVVGNITSVAAQPYTYSYRLSKDADVRIAVLDASTDDDIQYGITSSSSGSSATVVDVNEDDIVRMLVDWQPRLGEGMKGRDGETQITEFDSWDGRGDNGLLLPAGNYVVSLQAKTQDEWPGIDFSRAVTRQMSLDPLKLTDVVATGLTKQSTAYASIAYTPTESSKVYWYIYTPGTTFNDVLTNSAAQTGTAPTPTGGTLVYELVEDRVGRMNFTSKWDGTCQMQAGCTRTYSPGERMSDGTIATTTNNTETFAYGAPMPDGNYVYALWAEIPYNGCYYNKASGWTDGTHKAPYFDAGNACGTTGTSGHTNNTNAQAFTGVKTLKYNTGEIAIERGVVDITIQPVSYSTVGSSPTAYGLDPFIFKYSLARDSSVVAKVTNSAGVDVKYLTPKDGVTQVAQQMNTISWDGRDDAGRMVTPGTYMFVVETKDAMFPAVTNRASAVFPVDMYRVVDLATTDVYGDSDAKATISYSLSKAMSVQVNIYNKDVVIPNYQTSVGDYNSSEVRASVMTTGYTSTLTGNLTIDDTSSTTYTVPAPTGTTDLPAVGETVAWLITGVPAHRVTVQVKDNPSYVTGSTVWNEQPYLVTVVDETINITSGSQAWPPRICDKRTDEILFCPLNATFTPGTPATCEVTPGVDAFVNYVVPGRVDKDHSCIYVNDTSFTNYPVSVTRAASGVVDVRLQPIKTFERSALKPGDGLQITEEWDALYFYNPSEKTCTPGSTDRRNCKYEMVPDGQYPFYVSARSNEAFNRYYAHSTEQDLGGNNYLEGAPFKTSNEVKQEDYLYATDKVTSKINVTRGAVYFLDGSTVVYPNAPQLFNVSSGPVFVPPYEINFSVSRAATVEIAIVALQDNVCNPDPTVHQDLKNNRAGDVCKYLSTMTITNMHGVFDPNIVRKTYWDGTDNNGYYVKPAGYEVRLTARNYPNPDLYEATVKSLTVNADLLKVFDLLEADGYSISQRGTNMKIGYQVSVPMKVALQIFKPGTTIYDYQKGTLRNPTTGTEVQDIHEVLVKSIVGIRPATTLIEEVWDGTDYAGQEVPDGTYPFRFVTATNSADIDSVTGEIVVGDDTSATMSDWKINHVADTYEYQNLHKATIAIGDGQFVCSDWEKTVFFYPNPFNQPNGTLEITKMPVPGEISIKIFNLAGDLVRDSDYECVDANNYVERIGSSFKFQPDNNISTTKVDLNNFENIRNAALRCRWDKTNQHGKKVARGVYFGLIDFKAQMGREHCQKVVKVLIP